MRGSLAGRSVAILVLSIILWILLTVFEPALVGMSLATERLITLLGLVLLPGAGAVFGLMSLRRNEGFTVLAGTSVVLSLLFALFHLLIVLFAG